jgi:type VI secretion system protein ImpC
MSDQSQGQGGAPAAATTEASLLDEILGETQLKPADEGYDVTKRGIQALVKELLSPKHVGEKVDKAFADALIAEIDQKISKQVDVILHNAEFQKLESAWRGLKFSIDRTDFRENIKIELLNVSKQDLMTDFEDAPEITKCGLYKIAYTAEYGTFGGKPYGSIFSNYEFGPGPQDVQLLQNCAAVAAMSHAPFFGAAGPAFFGEKDYNKLPNLRDLRAIFEGPQYTKWQAFRESEDARYVGLLMPRFLLRLPYGNKTVPAKSFNYEEDVIGKHDTYSWGNATYAFASRIADSFAKYRWCPNIIGPQAGGSVENLPLHQYEAMGEIQTKIPTEIQISERREFELSEEGFISLTFRKDADNACFFSANSAQKPKTFGQSPEGKDAELNYRLGTQLPYMFVVCRIAHYIKVLQREQIGTWKERLDLENELNKWIGQYVADMDAVSPAVRGKRPLRQAQITVEDVPGNAGWYKVDMKVRPHFKYMGAFFTLSLVGKLDKE